MTGYESKRAAARDKLEALAQPTLQEQLDRAKAAWDKADAELRRVKKLMEQQNG